jgi:hypothetical protein
MAKISVSQIAKEWKVSRPTVQKRLKDGELSGSKDDKGAWQIDTSEVIRCFGEPIAAAGKVASNISDNVTSPLQAELTATLKHQVAQLEAQLEEANHMNRELMTQVSSQQKLIEHKTEKKRFGFF